MKTNIHLWLIVFSFFVCNNLTAVAQEAEVEEVEQSFSCFIDFSDVDFDVSTWCESEPLELPCVDFETDEAGPAGIMWAVYVAPPTSPDPTVDPSNQGDILLSNEAGFPIFNCNEPAFFSNTNILTDADFDTCVYLIPIINNDTTNNVPAVCTGIVPDFPSYPQICFIAEASCDDECLGNIPANDNCESSESVLLTDAVYGPYTNVCATTINDPAADGCFIDNYENTVWFSFSGNGGNYDIASINCEGSTETQLLISQMAVYSGSCDDLTLLACSDGVSSLDFLASITDFSTEVGIDYYVVVDGFEIQEGEFCLEIVENEPPPPCEADAGTLNITGANDAGTYCEGTDLEVSITASAGTGFISEVLVIDVSTGIIIEVLSVPTTATYAVGDYSFCALSYNVDQAADVNDLLASGTKDLLETAIANGEVCAALGEPQAVSVIPADSADCLSCEAAIEELATTNPIELCEGETVTLNAVANTEGYTTYFVVLDNANTIISNNAGDSFTFSEVEGNYNIFAFNILDSDTGSLTPLPVNLADLTALIDGLCAAYIETIIAVIVKPTPDIAVTPDSVLACEGDSFTLTANTSLTGTIAYDWTGPNISASPELVINNTTIDDGGTYTAVVSVNGCVSEAATVEVEVIPLPSISITASDTAVCPGNSANIILTAITDATSDVTFTWSNGATATTSENILEVEAITTTTEFCVDVALDDTPFCASETVCTTVTLLPIDNENCEGFCAANAGAILVDGSSDVCLGDELVIAHTDFTDGDDYENTFVLIDDGGSTSILTDLTPSSAGTFTIAVINYNIEDASAITGLLFGGASLADIQATIDADTLCADISDTLAITVNTAEDNPACFDCMAEIGTVTYPSDADTLVCEGGVSDPIVVEGNNTDADYTTVFIITDASGLILTNTTDNALNWSALGLAAGNYTVHVLNYALEFDAEIQTQINSGGTFNDLLNFIATNFYCAEADASSVNFTVLDSEEEDCAELCLASIGTITPPSSVQTCFEEVSEPIMVSGLPTDGFNTIYLITEEVGGVKQLISVSTTPDLICNGVGTFFIHVLNYSLDDEATVNDNLTIGSDLSDIIFSLSLSDACYALDNIGVAVECLDASDPLCLDPITAIPTETPSDDNTTYTVCLDISGGTGNYIVDSEAIDGNEYCSTELLCGETYSFEITDDIGSSVLVVSGVSPCPCATNPGIMPNLVSPAPVCSGGSVTLNTIDPVLLSGDVLWYVLHTDPTNVLGTILAINTVDGNFSIVDAPTATTNTIYYISAVAGPADADGQLLFDNECTTVAAGAPIVFLEPINIAVQEVCDFVTGDYIVTLSVTGGYPEFDDTETYNIFGDVLSAIAFGETETVVYPNGDGNTYEFFAEDAICEQTVTVLDEFICSQTVPIELISFKGLAQDNGNLISWSTASEFNNDYFKLERSSDGQNFAVIDEIDGAGTTNIRHNYNYLDTDIRNGIVYYRLTQVDFDGSSTRTDVISVNRKGEEVFAINEIYPIPARDFVEISFQAVNDGIVGIEVYSLAGRFIFSTDFDAQKGVNTYRLNIDSLYAGMYFLSINNGEEVITNRFLKE